MAERAPLNLLLVLAAAAPLLLAIVDFALSERNDALRHEIDLRQHVINQNPQLRGATQSLIRQMAVAAVKGHDDKLRELLSRNGITINVASPPHEEGNKGG